MTLELRYLRPFVAVVENGSIGRAARALGVAQPVLSRMMHALERDLGAVLLRRSGSGIELTAQGELFLPRARMLVAEAADALNELGDMGQLRQGVVRIGALSSALPMLFATALEPLLQRHGGLTALVLDGSADTLATRLVNREVDLLIGANLAPTDDIVAMGVLPQSDRLGVVASPRHPLAGGKVRVEDLADHRWVLSPRGTSPRDLLDGMVERLGLRSLVATVETRSASSLKAMIATGNYLGWLAPQHYLPEEAAGMIVALDVPSLQLERRYTLYRRRVGILPAPAQALATLLDPDPTVTG